MTDIRDSKKEADFIVGILDQTATRPDPAASKFVEARILALQMEAIGWSLQQLYPAVEQNRETLLLKDEIARLNEKIDEIALKLKEIKPS